MQIPIVPVKKLMIRTSTMKTLEGNVAIWPIKDGSTQSLLYVVIVIRPQTVLDQWLLITIKYNK